MDVLAAYRDVGSYRGAAAVCGTTHKTVKRIIEAHEAGNARVEKTPRVRNYDGVADLVAKRVRDSAGRISAKRLMPEARAAGYSGSARNLRRLVADAKTTWRQGRPRGRRPGVWAPGETLIIDWGVLDGVHVFCAVLAWSRFRFVRFAADEKAATTLGMLAECFEELGGVPKVVLADRMGCLKGGVVANVVVPTPDYVRFATHYRFRPDFCEAADPESKGMVENLVGYAKDDLMVPQAPWIDLGAANAAAGVWCAEVNANRHSEICAVPADRLAIERGLLAALPSLRAEFGAKPTTRKVDKLSCIRFGSGRYSVPNRLIGTTVTVLVDDRTLLVIEPVTGQVFAEHALVAPGETSIVDDHYGGPRPDRPRRGCTPEDGDREGVPGPGAGRGGVPYRGCGGRGHEADRRDRRDPHPGCSPRHRPGAGRAGTCGRVRAVARRRRPFHPGHQRPGTDTSPRRASPGADAAEGADQVAGGLPHRRR